MKVNYHILPNSVVVNFDGETYTVNSDDSRYPLVVEALTSGNDEKVPELVNPRARFSDPERGLEFKDNTVYIEGESIPEDLANRVLDFKAKGLPYQYLMSFAKKLKSNPSANSRNMLYRFLEHNGHPITKEGNFIAYRGVSKALKDMHTGKFDNSVGAVCEMPRNEVDENPNNTCSRGLHVACYDYAKGFGEVLVEVEVDPRDVVCVPTDYNGTKMRTCKFKVVAICKNQREEALYDYDNWAEDDWQDDFDETYMEFDEA